jgi:hypothetical protein
MSSKLCRYALCPIFLTVCYFLEGKHGGMCSPKIGEPSLATEGYEHRLRGMNVSKRLAVYRR